MTDNLPTYTPRAKAAWRRLREHKRFLLKTEAGTYFVDRGGYATLMVEGKARGASVKAAGLLDESKKEALWR